MRLNNLLLVVFFVVTFSFLSSLTLATWRVCGSSNLEEVRIVAGVNYVCCGPDNAPFCDKGGTNYFQDKGATGSYEWRFGTTCPYNDADNICRGSFAVSGLSNCVADDSTNGLVAGSALNTCDQDRDGNSWFRDAVDGACRGIVDDNWVCQSPLSPGLSGCTGEEACRGLSPGDVCGLDSNCNNQCQCTSGKTMVISVSPSFVPYDCGGSSTVTASTSDGAAAWITLTSALSSATFVESGGGQSYTCSFGSSCTGTLTSTGTGTATVSAEASGYTTTSRDVTFVSGYQDPYVGITPSTQQGLPGEAKTYTVTVSNSNNPNCPATTYSLSSFIPTQLSMSGLPASVTVNSNGVSYSYPVVTSSATAPEGTYTFSVTASIPTTSFSDTGYGSYQVIGCGANQVYCQQPGGGYACVDGDCCTVADCPSLDYDPITNICSYNALCLSNTCLFGSSCSLDPYLLGEYCYSLPTSCTAVNGCTMTEYYCPIPGTVSGGICYYGTRSCDSAGCGLDTAPLLSGQVCDPVIGPTTSATTTTTIPPGTTTTIPLPPGCTLNSATITPQCANCQEGDNALLQAQFSGDCSGMGTLQVDAISSDGACDIAYVGGDISGMTTSVSIAPSDLSTSGLWTLPAIPADCQCQTVDATFGGLWPGDPGIGSGTTAAASGSLTFDCPGPVCGNGVCDAGEDQDGCPSDCRTVVDISPDSTYPGQTVTLTVYFYDSRYAVGGDVSLDLSIDGQNWQTADCAISGAKWAENIGWDQSASWSGVYSGRQVQITSQSGYARLETSCVIPEGLDVGSHVLVATPSIYSEKIDLAPGNSVFVVSYPLMQRIQKTVTDNSLYLMPALILLF